MRGIRCPRTVNFVEGSQGAGSPGATVISLVWNSPLKPTRVFSVMSGLLPVFRHHLDGGGSHAEVVREGSGVACGRSSLPGLVRIGRADPRGLLAGVDDVGVGPAAAEVARDGRGDVVAGGLRVRVEEDLEGHDHPGGAEAALKRVGLDEGLLDGGETPVLREALDGDDLAAGDLVGERQTRTDGL